MSVTLPLEHLYLHFPFCTGRCGYCAFISGLPPADPTAYIDTLLTEATQRHLTLAPLKTLYCGGGTPGLIGPKGFQALTHAGLFTFAKDYEWSVELHPTIVTPELMQTLAECGVTRISIGVQSFDDAVLQRCNRRHTLAQALAAVALARRFIPDTGIDLIAGLPGVTKALWSETLSRTLELDLPHLSIYSLSIDEGSAWARAGMEPPNAEQVCDAIAEAEALLATAGLHRYETSNYAREGYQCQHNLNTWQGGDYVGLGHGAASRIGALRRATTGEETHLDPLEDALERALTQLRLAEGFDLKRCIARYPHLAPFATAWEKRLAELRQFGLLTAHNAPTTRGYEVLDAIERTLLEATL
jgi:oxygen-independent coproporphyrinogen-3 oxidase